ncbi:helix-turn-helix domain-containing protein [Leifsonia aquatica]|uniref:helix-turn-helix domain-containing protein n=1 Tax=Leifsonia aquatica TaxID=144185 RepID=UPI0028A920CF|nr:helix-turn-helix transcriptional regulator [Leifsonia aquatica]
MLLRHALGSVLRRIRTEQGTTLRQLSETSRVSIPYLSEIERGRKEASSEILAALCRVLEVPEGELLTRVAAEFAAAAGAQAAAPAQVLSLVPERDEVPASQTAVAAVAEPASTTETAPAALLLVA